MTGLTTAQAAELFGVDVATIRRRIRAGILAAQKDSGGRYLVALPEDTAYLAYLNDLLAEVRRHRDELQRQVESQRRDLDRAAHERAELEDLVLSLRRPTLRAVPPKATTAGLGTLATAAVGATASTGRWAEFGARGDKKDLGASLVLTGVVAMAAGVMLQLALQTHAVDSAVHLGYILGLVGLLLLLIGLVIVY